MKHFYVVSEPYESKPYGHYEPPEVGCDVALVEAETPEDAIRLALKTKEMRGWVKLQRGDGKPPMVGLRAEDQTCVHGKCLCDACKNECDDCEAMSNIMYSAGVFNHNT